MAAHPHDQIEFIDAEPPWASAPAGRPSDGAPDSRVPGSQVPGARALAVPIAWIAAAACCLLATFQTIFTYRFTGGSVNSAGGYDAWGNPLHSTLAGEHGPRYGLALWVCAAAIALLATASLHHESTGKPRRAAALRRLATIAGPVVSALLAGVLVGIALDVESSVATYRALAATLHDGGAGGGVELSIGSCLWFGTAALACCIAALVLSTPRFAPNRR